MKKLLCTLLTLLMVFGVYGALAEGAGEGLTIGFSQKTRHSPYYIAMDEAMHDLAEEFGFELISVNAGADLVKQQADIEDLISRGVDLLIVDSQDPIGIVAISKNIAEAGIPLFLLNTTVDPSAEYITLVQSNNVTIGNMVGEWLGNNVSGEIRIGLLSGNPGNMVGYGRRSGVFQGIAEAQLISTNTTNFRVLTQGWGGWSAEGGLEAAEDMLTAAPDINVIFAENDSMALGAVTAIKNVGKEGEIVVVGIDGQREALELIKEGVYGASGLNSPFELARITVDIALRYHAGERGFPQLIHTTPSIISAENVDQYYDPDIPFGFMK